MPIAYPANLPPLQRASKSRSQPARFTIAEPRRGYGYAQATGTDTPVFWDGQFKFSAENAVVYQLWLTQDLQGGLLEFSMPIRTEFGLLVHTCRFLDDGLNNASEEGGVWIYPVKIMARRQLIPQAFIDAQDLITQLPNWGAWAQLLDQSIAELPEA